MNELKTILNNEVFLGRGWSFPPQITDGDVRMSAYEQDIEDTPRLHGYPHEQPQQYGLSVLSE